MRHFWKFSIHDKFSEKNNTKSIFQINSSPYFSKWYSMFHHRCFIFHLFGNIFQFGIQKNHPFSKYFIEIIFKVKKILIIPSKPQYFLFIVLNSFFNLQRHTVQLFNLCKMLFIFNTTIFAIVQSLHQTLDLSKIFLRYKHNIYQSVIILSRANKTNSQLYKMKLWHPVETG